MKKLILTVMALGLVLSGANAYAITIDGSLADWNSGFLSNTDGVFTHPPQGQEFDVELIGMFLQNENLYFGLQSGFSFSNKNFPVRNASSGEIFLDLGSNGSWDYAIDYAISNLTARTYQTAEAYLPNNSGNGDVEFTVYNTSQGIIAPSTYPDGTPYHVVKNAASKVGSMSVLSNAYGWYNDHEVWQSGDKYFFHNILEGYIPLEMLGLTEEMINYPISIHYTMWCGNDSDDYTYPVPEPMTMALLGMGVLGLVVRRKK